MPPRSRNHRLPTACDTPARTPASSLVQPRPIACQNRSMLLRHDRRPARRPHRRNAPSAPPSSPLVVPSHTSASRCCDDRLNPPWRAAVGVEDHLGGQLAAQGDGPSEGGLDQVGAEVVLDGPADDAAGAAVADGAQVQPALAGGQVGDVGGPDPVQLAVVEAAADQVADRLRVRPGLGGDRNKPRGLIPAIPACRISLATVLPDTAPRPLAGRPGSAATRTPGRSPWWG